MNHATCERCGAPLPEEARFCPQCGAPVLEGSDEERRVVTVLFADVAGSTELAASLEAERLREVMAAFFQAASEEVVALRGRTEKFIGDAVMAVFGLPIAHEDDALRAVRAGITVRERTAKLSGQLGLAAPLRVRIGINTGPVVAGVGSGADFLVSGAAVNAAARLEQAAEPDEVLVGETTWQLTQHAASFGSRRQVAAKGFSEEVSAWPVQDLTPKSTRRTIPLVGRRHELSLLTGSFERAMEIGRTHLVTIVGEPGIGKSRLVDEFLVGLPEGTEVLEGSASAFAEDVALAPMADMIRRRLGGGEETEASELKARLTKLVSERCEPSEAELVTARLGLLLGLGEEDGETARYRTAEIRAGLTSFLVALSQTGPVVVVIEDLHLAKPALLDFLEEEVHRAGRLPHMVVAVGREELLRERPAWGAGVPNALFLRLQALPEDEAKELAHAAAGGLDEEAAERVARHTGGNPFFIVETTGMLLSERSGRVIGPAGLVLPPTVQAVIAARLDQLPEEARELIRKASVFPGGELPEPRLALVAEVRPEVLSVLEEHELIVPDGDRTGAWRFRHEALRDVAYESLPQRERRRLHELVADALEPKGDAHAYEIAYHLEQAARAALALDPEDRGPAERAKQALHHAGDIARRRMVSRVAIDLYERSLLLAGPEVGWGEDEGRVLAGIGEARYWVGEYDGAESALHRALEVGGADNWTRAHALRFAADIALNIRGDTDRAEAEFEQALGAARAMKEDDAPWVIARTLLMAGWVPYWKDDLASARATFEEALRIARENPDGDPWAEARALNSLVSVVAPVGDAEEALALSQQALGLGKEMGDPFTIAGAQENVGSSLRRLLRLDEAIAGCEEAVRIYRELGAPWELASALGDRGTINRLAGRLVEAETDLRESLKLCLELGERALVAWTASELASVLYLRGDLEGARRVLDETTLPEAPEPPSRSAIVQIEALLARAEGDEARARELAARLLELERGSEIPNWSAAATWWVGRLFGADLVGGEEVLEEARRRLELVHWEHALLEPDLVKGSPAAVG